MEYLDLFERRYKGVITNFWLEPIRSGLTDTQAIIEWGKMSLEKSKFRKEWIGHCCTGRLIEREISSHYQTVADNLDHPNLPAFLDYYIKYTALSYEQKQIAKKNNINTRARKKAVVRSLFDGSRPLSWSAISSFEYDPNQFAEQYIFDKKIEGNSAMDLGKEIHERLSSDPTYLPEVPRLDTFEKKFLVKFGKLKLIGFADSYCSKTKRKIYEYKTGKNWTQKKVDEHGQIDMYLLMNYITHKINPEEVEVSLIWLPTDDNGLIEPVIPQVFKTKRTMTDILKFGEYVNEIYNRMKDYAEKLSPTFNRQ